MASGEPADRREADGVPPDEQVFTPETDRLIRDISTMSDRWSLNPFMFGDASSRAGRGQKLTLRDALAAFRGWRRRRHDPPAGG